MNIIASPLSAIAHRCRAVLAAWLCMLAAPGAGAQPAPDHGGGWPERLSDTGLYLPGSHTQPRPDVIAFTPQYPLWSDGADKRRWLRLPAGGFIDAADPDAWVFPPGTRLWKEFSHAGRRIETRAIERRADGSWHYASYVWNEAGDDARLVPARGLTVHGVAQLPQGRYEIPSRADCTGCHESTAQPVLGFGALQLSAARDPLAPHGQALQAEQPSLRDLAARGLLRNLPRALLDTPPRIAAATADERAALGYLHANCGHCHNRSGQGVPLRLNLAQSVADPAGSRTATLRSALQVQGRFRTPLLPAQAPLIAAGDAARSVLVLRMRTRQPQLQMPPIGTRIADDEGLALVERWIHHDLSNPLE